MTTKYGLLTPAAPRFEKVPPLSLGTNDQGAELSSWTPTKQPANCWVDLPVTSAALRVAGNTGAAAVATTLSNVMIPMSLIAPPVPPVQTRGNEIPPSPALGIFV